MFADANHFEYWPEFIQFKAIKILGKSTDDHMY